MWERKKQIKMALMAMLCVMTANVWAGSWQNNQPIGGFSRVHIYTPDSVSPIGQGRSLLVVLHGCTQSIDAYLSANLAQAAEQFGMVIAVPDAMNKAGFNCWSYWQGTKSRTAGDYQNLIRLATALRSDINYAIDDDQVYIAGLSSGASFANTTACLAPDIFAGMGISAGPSIGTSSSGAIGNCEAANVASRCQSYAGSFQTYFDTQVASIAHGDVDTTVDTCYNQQNAQGMAAVYNASSIQSSQQIVLEGRSADETLWQDNRVSMLWLNGVDHAWSGGPGASGAYISGAGINYAKYLAQYFIDNNQRVERNQAPTISNLVARNVNSTIEVSADVNDVDGQVVQVDIVLEDSGANIYTLSTQSVSSGSLLVTSASLADELYRVTAVATDELGAESESISTTVRIGPAPPATAPQISEVSVSVTSQCVAVTGKVIDVNQDLNGVHVEFATGTQPATLQGNQFSAQGCNQPGGAQSASIVAMDTSGLHSSVSVSYVVDAGQTATLDQHINNGRLDYTNYANCYLEYSSNPFKLNEVALSDLQCQWQDDDGSCMGPAQACTGAPGEPGGGDNGAECEAISNYNYYHKTSGRAYSTGNPYAPDYFAQGSDQLMPGSTWGSTTLHSLDGQTWLLGSCP